MSRWVRACECVNEKMLLQQNSLGGTNHQRNRLLFPSYTICGRQHPPTDGPMIVEILGGTACMV